MKGNQWFTKKQGWSVLRSNVDFKMQENEKSTRKLGCELKRKRYLFYFLVVLFVNVIDFLLLETGLVGPKIDPLTFRDFVQT